MEEIKTKLDEMREEEAKYLKFLNEKYSREFTVEDLLRIINDDTTNP